MIVTCDCGRAVNVGKELHLCGASERVVPAQMHQSDLGDRVDLRGVERILGSSGGLIGKTATSAAKEEETPDVLITWSRRNQDLNHVISEIVRLHDKKSHDYALPDNVWYNFEVAAQLAGTTVDQSFGVLIGVKIARLLALTRQSLNKLEEGIPHFESLDDTYLDLCNYILLRRAYRRYTRFPKEKQHLNKIREEKLRRHAESYDYQTGYLAPEKH